MEEIEIVSSFECEYVFNPLGFVFGEGSVYREEKKMGTHKMRTVVSQYEMTLIVRKHCCNIKHFFQQ